MDADIYQELLPKQYLKRFLEQGVRNDGRSINQQRAIRLQFNHDNSSQYQYAASYLFTEVGLYKKEMSREDFEAKKNIGGQLLRLKNGLPDDQSQNNKTRLVSHIHVLIQDILRTSLEEFSKKSFIQAAKKYEMVEVLVLKVIQRVSGSDGSLESHLIKSLAYTLANHTDRVVLPKQDLFFAFHVSKIDNQQLIDPNRLEETQADGTSILIYQKGKIRQVKLDGKTENLRGLLNNQNFIKDFVEASVGDLEQFIEERQAEKYKV